MKRLLLLLIFAAFAGTAAAQVQPSLPTGSVPFGNQYWRDTDNNIWTGSEFNGYINLGFFEKVVDSLGMKINWSDTTALIATKQDLAEITVPVTSVAGKTGDVLLDKNDVGLGNVDNTSDLDKPISTATQTALDGKQNTITGAATTIDTENLTANRAVISSGTGKVAVSAVTSTELSRLDGVTSNVQTQLNAKLDTAEVGMTGGVAPLGNDGKVPSEYLPTSGSYKGTWDASTNTPTLADGVGTNGDRYRVSVGGTQDLGSGNITFVAGDDVIYNGTVWQRSPSGVTVTSVAGKTGDVILNKSDVGLGNVDNTSDLNKPISTATQAALDTKVNDTDPRLDAQTLSANVFPGSVSISGGNSISLWSLLGLPYETWGASTYGGLRTILTAPGATGYPSGPSETGAGIFRKRAHEDNQDFSGSFAFWKSIANDGNLYMNVSTSGTGWNGWETVASEEWANSVFATQASLGDYFPMGAGTGNLPSTYSGDVNLLNTGITYVSSGSATNTPPWATTDGLVITGEGASARQLWIGRFGEIGLRGGTSVEPYTDEWIQLAVKSEVPTETVIPTTVNFTIDWDTDIAPGSTETYAALHGNHFVYSAFYDSGNGEVNYSPAVRINRDVNGDITTVEFADVQSGGIIIK